MKNKFVKVTATLKAEKKVSRFINQCFDIIIKMMNNKLFKSPPVSYDAVIADIEELRKAEFMARVRTPGAVMERDNQRRIVEKHIRSFHRFVQDFADNAENEKNANALIIASGFGIRRKRTFVFKSNFSVKQDMLTGDLVLRVKSAGKRATYEWQVSTDMGENYTYLPPTLKVSTIVCNPVPYQKIFFRFRSLTPILLSNWSDPKMIIPVEVNVPVVIPEKRVFDKLQVKMKKNEFMQGRDTNKRVS
jgi:hypothetical protein